MPVPGNEPGSLTFRANVVTTRPLWLVFKSPDFSQWRTVRVCKVFSEYPGISGKYFFEKAYSLED